MLNGCKQKRREPFALLWMPLEVHGGKTSRNQLPPLGVVATQTLVEVAVGILCTRVHWLGLSPGAHALEVSGGCSSSHGCVCCGILLLSFPQQVLAEGAAQLVLEHESAGGPWRQSGRVYVGRCHDDGLGSRGLLTHH